MTARVAIPVFAGRVSPRLDCASRFLLYEASDGGRTQEVHLSCRAPREMAERLRELEVGVVICGGVSTLYEQRLSEAGLKLIPWVSGPVAEIIEEYSRGALQPGQRCRQSRSRQRHGLRRGLGKLSKEVSGHAKT